LCALRASILQILIKLESGVGHLGELKTNMQFIRLLQSNSIKNKVDCRPNLFKLFTWNHYDQKNEVIVAYLALIKGIQRGPYLS